jgi:hypothetical protein
MKRSSKSCSRDNSCAGHLCDLLTRRSKGGFGKGSSSLLCDVRLAEAPDLRKGLGGGNGEGVVTLESERVRRRLNNLQTVFRPAAKSIRSNDTCAHEISGSARCSSASTLGCEMVSAFMIVALWMFVALYRHLSSTSQRLTFCIYSQKSNLCEIFGLWISGAEINPNR